MQLQQRQLDLLSSSLSIELLENFLKPTSNKRWLQKIVNLLKQALSARHVVLHTYIDNLIVCASDDIDFIRQKTLNGLIVNPANSLKNEREAAFNANWLGKNYIFPLSVEGCLEIMWDEIPTEDEIRIYNQVLLLLESSLRNRSDLISQEHAVRSEESLLKVEKILNCDFPLKKQIYSLAKEITMALNVSRCQIKVFSQSDSLVFDNQMSSEFVTAGVLEAISVIPSVEREWIKRVQEGEVLILDQRKNIFLENVSKDIESLLSIQSILGYSLFYKGEAIGVLVLHQCDYGREWKSEEILYLRELSLLLSIVIGKELEFSEKYHNANRDLNTNIINSDEFLKKLEHLQLETQIKNSIFSLIMLDIEKLNDVNLKMGFVAGNLVLSQTARYLNRMYGNSYPIARYNNDEFVIIMEEVDHNKARLEAERLKEQLSNISVLGVGPIDYNFSFVTFPTHANSVAGLLTLLEQAMILSKARGKSQISSFDEVQGEPQERWQQLVSNAIPEIIIKKSSLKTGPEVFESIKQSWSKQKNNYSADILDSVQSLALALDAKDSYTEGHSKRVSEYAYMLAKHLSLDLQEIEWIRLAASMHDIGKIGIPESILCKPGKLTKEEYDVMKKHPVIGARILKPIKPLEKVVSLVLYHHECWNGSGYPNGLLKNEIPIGSRIVSIVDAYQAMTSHRPYRAGLPFEEAVRRLRDGKEKQWDSDLVELFIKIVS